MRILGLLLMCLMFAGNALAQDSFADRLQRTRASIASKPADLVHAILVGDTWEIDGAVADLTRVKKLLTDSFAESECNISVLNEDKVTKDDLVDAIRRIPNTAMGQTIFVYVSSHGSIDAQRQHTLELDVDVPREEIVQEIWCKKPQLGILLTDTYLANSKQIDPNALRNLQNWASAKTFVKRLKKRGELPTNRQAVRNLFLRHEGMVDINACLPGQVASSDVNHGGFFTLSFAMSCCHDQAVMAPPPRRTTSLPEPMMGKVDGVDFNISLHPVDRDKDGMVDWHEFTASLVANYLAVFHGGANQNPWVIRLNADDWQERDVPADIRVMFGVASAKVIGLTGQPQEIGVGRTLFICNDEMRAKEYVGKEFPNRKDIATARDESDAKVRLTQVFHETFPNETIITGTLSTTLRMKYGQEDTSANNPPPGRPNIHNREYMEWLKKNHPDSYNDLMKKFGHFLKDN